MKRPKKKIVIKRKPSRPRLMDTAKLCKELVALAAFALYDNPAASAKIYEAVRQLQLLDKSAIEAGLIHR